MPNVNRSSALWEAAAEKATAAGHRMGSHAWMNAIRAYMRERHDGNTNFEFSGNRIKIPLTILNALQVMEFSDEQIYLMTPRERFIAYCEWEGLVNWGGTLWDAVVDSQ